MKTAQGASVRNSRFALICLVVLLSACGRSKWVGFNDRVLEASPSEAETMILALSPDEQVDYYIWAIEHSRPPAAPYDYLLKNRGAKTAPRLIDYAASTHGFLQLTNVLAVLATFDAETRRALDKGKLDRAIRNCLDSSKGSPLCHKYEKEILN